MRKGHPGRRLGRVLVGMAVLFAGSHANAAAPAPCTEPEHRQLDFWVGDWDAYDAGDPGTIVARARVDAILGGCALRETYEGTNGLVGQSFSIYDAARKRWHQTWVTNRGQLLTIEGRLEGDRLTLQGPQPSANGPPATVRAFWMPQAGGVRETARTSTDGGATWRPLFDILFQPHRAGAAMPDTSESDRSATETLTQLNREYIDAFMKADAGWYRDHLADDFVCVESDGSVLGRDEFLRKAARGPDVATYSLAEVRIRVFGQVALVHGTGRFARRDGTQGTSRYTDAYVLRDGSWKAVSAQITRSQD